MFVKLATFQSLIPQFDGESAVTPKYFLDVLENIAETAECSTEEKLILLKSKLRGPKLERVINSPDLALETQFDKFKEKFTDYFTTKSSLTANQNLFSQCKMNPGEAVKIFATRVTNATRAFFGSVDATNKDVQSLLEQTKLSKFMDGLLPDYKQAIILKDPKTFKDAVDFVELLQTNAQYTTPLLVNNVTSGQNNGEYDKFEELLNKHAQQTHETIAALSAQINQMTQ